MKPARPYKRVDRVSNQILDILANILIKDINLNHLGFISFTHVDVAPDLKSAKVFFSVLNPNFSIKKITIELNKKRKAFKKFMSSELHLKNTPDIAFYYNDSLEHQNKIESLLKHNTLNNNKDDS